MAGKSKKEAVGEATAASAQSILVSGISFFASTFGVGLYSNIDIISSMCSLIARGALCSVAVVLFLLPSMLLLCDGFIAVSYTHLAAAKLHRFVISPNMRTIPTHSSPHFMI